MLEGEGSGLREVATGREAAAQSEMTDNEVGQALAISCLALALLAAWMASGSAGSFQAVTWHSWTRVLSVVWAQPWTQNSVVAELAGTIHAADT